MTIRSKFLLTIGLALLLPAVVVFFVLTLLHPTQLFGGPKDNELKMSAILAGQMYKQQEARVLQGALEAAEQISANALVEQLSVMQPIPGASSRPGVTSLNPQRETPLKNFNGIAAALHKKYDVDFLILTDTEGKILTTASTIPALDEAIKKGPLFSDLKNARVSSVRIPSQILPLLPLDKTGNNQNGSPPKVEDALAIEAIAPVLRVQGELLGLVFAGHIVNDSKVVVSAAKSEISRGRNTADVTIIFQNQTVTTTVDGAAKGQRLPIDPAFSASLDPAVRSLDLAGHRVVGGFYPIRTPNAVIGQVMVSQPTDARTSGFSITEGLSLIDWPAIYALAATFIVTMIVVLILTSRLTKALRRVNTDIIRIGLGDFEDVIDPPTRHDEAGDLVESLERLRVTVKQAIDRLRRRK